MCLYPKVMYQFVDVETGEVRRSFKFVPDSAPGYQRLLLPCGKCVECCEAYSREWSFRVMDELAKYDKSVCITLTYNDEHLPDGSNLCKHDYQLFLKLLRKHCGKVRYFGCGEYGSKFRPHYHIILFGIDFDDKYFWCKSKSGDDLFRSPTLERLWTKGYSYIGKVDLSTAKYCSKYLQKFLIENYDILEERVRPFMMMSNRPGIGGDYRKCLETDKLYFNGSYVKTPRYYLKQAERDNVDLSELRQARKDKALLLERSSSELRERRKSVFSRLFRQRH